LALLGHRWLAGGLAGWQADWTGWLDWLPHLLNLAELAWLRLRVVVGNSLGILLAGLLHSWPAAWLAGVLEDRLAGRSALADPGFLADWLS
jgi:hypothetical protein